MSPFGPQADKAPNQFGAYMSRWSGVLMARCSSNGANVRCCEEYAVALTTWPRVRLKVPSIKATSSIAPIASPRRNKSRCGDDVHAVAHGEHTRPVRPAGTHHGGARKLCDAAVMASSTCKP